MEKLILTTNMVQIENEIANESRYASRFQPFVTEFLKSDFDCNGKLAMEVIQEIVLLGTLEEFLKRQALRQLPEIDRMLISNEMKMRMVDVTLVYPNANALEYHYNTIRQLTPQIKRKIQSFDIDVHGNLKLNESFCQMITDKHTVYANKKQSEAYARVSALLDEAKRLQVDTGINLFTPGLITGFNFGKIADCQVNPHAILQMP